VTQCRSIKGNHVRGVIVTPAKAGVQKMSKSLDSCSYPKCHTLNGARLLLGAKADSAVRALHQLTVPEVSAAEQ
jgi:hypothetical protein